jgi:tripartite-type tricarboxylate transporter receptor subunit TctC
MLGTTGGGVTMPARKIIVVAATLAALAAPARAQDWPTRPVTMIVPFAAGGAFDVLGRILAPRMSESLGQQVVVENVAGAGGVIAAVRVARAPADGYQFLLGDSSVAHDQTIYKNPRFNAIADFAPVALIADQPTVLIVRKDLPVNNLPEFIAYAKANQAKMQFGSAGTGSPIHLACVLLNLAIAVNVTHIPYRGGAPAIQDLVGGRIDYLCPIATTAIPPIESKQVKAIAILTRNRSPSLPALASADEQGLANFEAGAWNAIFLPGGTPAAIVQKLHSAAVAAMEAPEVRSRLDQLGATIVAPERRSPEYLQSFVESEIEKWAAPIKAANITAD